MYIDHAIEKMYFEKVQSAEHISSVTEDEKFIEEQLTENQQFLYAYIMKRVANADLAKDILQESNVVIWKKRAEFKPGTKFTSWMLTIAHFQVLAALKKIGREPLVFGDDIIVAQEKESDYRQRRIQALEECMADVSPENRELIKIRYSGEKSVGDIASEENKSVNAISKILHRCRMALSKCISQKLRSES